MAKPLTDAEKLEAKREYMKHYMRQYRLKNRKMLNEKAKKYRETYPERVEASYVEHWNRKAAKLAD